MRHLVFLALLLLATPAVAAPVESFDAFLRNFEARAFSAGVTRETWRAATTVLTPDGDVPDLVETQPEFTTAVWDYLDKRVTAGRIERGQAAIRRCSRPLGSAPGSIPTFSAPSGAWRPTTGRCWATAS